MPLTPAQLTLLRDRHPHFASMYLSILAPDMSSPSYPDVIYAGTVNGAHVRGARAITCANLAPPVGNIANVVAGQTVLVGTSVGDSSISKRRLRSQVGQVLTLDANGVVWTAGDTITVVRNWEFWPVFPRILNVAPYTMYKDYDVVYTDENVEAPPVAIMGPPWAGWLADADAIILDGSDSYAIAAGGAGLTYLWQTTGGAIANANIATTTIDFSGAGAGLYWVNLTVTDGNGKTQITYRPFFIHDEVSFPPFYDFTADISLTFGQGNDLRISALRDVDFDEIPDQAMVVLWGDEYFRQAGNPPAWTKESIGGWTDYEHIKFVGYLDRESITSDPEDAGALSFDAYSINKIMSETTMWAIALNDILGVPTTWYQYQDLTTTRAIHHLWRWHSTVFSVADVMLPVSNTSRRFAIDYAEGSLIGQARIAAWDQGIYANTGCDKQGRVYVELDPQMIPEADRGAIVDTVQTLTDEDWFDEIELIRNERIRTAWVNFSGLAWDGATKSPFVSTMPGEADGAAWDSTPEVSGGIKEEGNKLLVDQNDANEKAGLVYARDNNTLEEIRVPAFAGNYSHVDVYPQSYLQVSIPPNKRGLDTTDQRNAIPRRVDITYDPANGVVAVSAALEPETEDVIDGVPGNYPTTTPDPTPNPGVNYPEPEEEAGGIAGFTFGDGAWWGTAAGAAWVKRNSTRAGAQLNDRYGYVDPWGPHSSKKGSYDPEKAILWAGGLGYIYRSDDGGRYWLPVTPTTDPPNAWNEIVPPTAATVTYEMGVADWHTNRQHYWIAWYQDPASAYRGYLLHTDDDGRSWAWYALGSDHLTVATWGLPQIASGVDFWCDPDAPGAGNPTRTLVTQNNILVDNGAGGGGQVNFVARPDNTTLFERILLVDFGTWFQLTNATLDAGNNVTARLLSSVDTMTITDPTKVNVQVDITSLNWTQCSGDEAFLWGWTGAVDGYPPATPSIKSSAMNATDYHRYAWIQMHTVGAGNLARYRGTGLHRHLMDYIKVYPNAVEHELLPISIDIDKENGKFLYMSIWEGQQLRVRVYDITLTLTHPVANVRIQTFPAIGGVTRANVENRSYWHAVKSPYIPAWANYGDKFMIYGGWQSAAGVYAHTLSLYMNSDKHFSVDAGWGGDDGTWTGVAAPWAGALKWPSQNNVILALNDRTPADPDLWETTDYATSWNNRSTIPLTSGAGRGIEFGMAMHNGSSATIAAADRAGNEIFKQNTPWTGAWTDITPAGSVHTRCAGLRWIYNEVP